MKSPLRYPGGKSRAVKQILPLIPEDCGELCSPFLGGGSIELAANARGMKVYGYDEFVPLVWFWEQALARPEKVADRARKFSSNVLSYTSTEKLVAQWESKKKCRACTNKKECRARSNDKSHDYCIEHKKLDQIWREEVIGISEATFKECRADLVNAQNFKKKSTLKRAAQYFIVNKASFSGATTSGGWSWRASWDRFNESSLERLAHLKLENFTVQKADYRVSIKKHKDAFLYLDPPYYLEGDKNKLYGHNGNLHQGFDHVEFYQSIKKINNPFIISYNQSDFIKMLYEEVGLRCYDLAGWAYGMSATKTKESSEMIITNLPEEYILKKMGDLKGDTNGKES